MTAGPINDTSVFPDPVYKETVLRPLFDGAKDHHVEGFRRIDRAHLVMLHETGILTTDQARPIARALPRSRYMRSSAAARAWGSGSVTSPL